MSDLARAEALEAIIKATIIETPQGQPCYRTINGVPMEMPKRVELLVRKHLAAVKTRRATMPRPVCVNCQCEFRREKDDTGVVQMDGYKPYSLWSGDLWKCPGCEAEIVIVFGKVSITKHQPEFEAAIKAHQRPGERIVYVYEGSADEGSKQEDSPFVLEEK